MTRRYFNFSGTMMAAEEGAPTEAAVLTDVEPVRKQRSAKWLVTGTSNAVFSQQTASLKSSTALQAAELLPEDLNIQVHNPLKKGELCLYRSQVALLPRRWIAGDGLLDAHVVYTVTTKVCCELLSCEFPARCAIFIFNHVFARPRGFSLKGQTSPLRGATLTLWCVVFAVTWLLSSLPHPHCTVAS